ncbi:molecular chaperone [Nodosilinea sp. LEGE 07298]|uniref:fimbrial biogenesis chaperone n=1 Tax=Nodosilinea sp. LEGE 07298 TaxID=2777970 RepID=UPI00187FF415|nr:fimbria/pilus periplasmic chaperone [Nodosilinea sp. LEGE 07298]MBE9111160.1 molecular chaperone [Nodosilinea sp. LEGE 07298]
MKTLARIGCLASLLVGAGALVAPPGWADATYQLLPSTLTLEPSGSRSTGSFQVRSTGDEPVAVEIRVTERQMDLQGTETRPDAEDDFVVYPPQILLQPGQVQTVRVTWLGEPNPEHELPYRLIAEQLPIAIDEPEAVVTTAVVRINALYNFVASLYISPRGSSPNIVIESASHQTINGQDALVLQFNNQGTAHKVMTGLHLTLTAAGGQTITLSPEQLQGVSGENMLAQHQRQFTLPWPDGLPVGPVSATIDLR